jgi:Cft2 family RNA processing exonuclease
MYLPDIDLWLDPQVPRPNAWLSHGHSDHARGLHSCAVATPETLRIYRLRWPEEEGCPQTFRALAYGESLDWNGARLTAYPASHIVGAAQLLVEHRGERLVYTGDIKLRAPICGATTQVVPCDHLIIESTFGLPIYKFLDREQAIERIVRIARECLDDGCTPVFMGYPLGRGQEAAWVLCQAGIPTAVHGAIGRLVPIYQAAGYDFPGLMPYVARETEGKALVVVPNFRAQIEASGKNMRLVYVSGWASLDNARMRAGAEALVPYSDHADFDELLAIVEGTGARRVDVVHGYTEALCRVLSAKGIDARAPRAAAARLDEDTSEAGAEG